MKLEDVLELMHLARRQYTTIEARIRHRFEPALVEAHRSNDVGPATLAQAQVEAVDHVWFQSPVRWRVDAESGPGAGLVSIHDGEQTFRNFRFEDLGEGSGRGAYLGGPETYRQVMWEPNMLIPEMWLSRTSRCALPVARQSELADSLDRRAMTTSSSGQARTGMSSWST